MRLAKFAIYSNSILSIVGCGCNNPPLPHLLIPRYTCAIAKEKPWMKPISYYHLLERWPQPGCAICNLLLHEAEQFLDAVLYEYTTDPAMNLKFRASRGLCSEHGWQMTQMRNALGVAILYEAALDEALKNIHRAENTPRKRLFGGKTEPATMPPCPVCQQQAEQETRLVGFLGEYIRDEKMQAAYRASSGLCLDHFKQVIAHAPDAATAQLITTIQQAIWEQLRAELREFITKNNAEYAEPFGREADSWRRAVMAISGQRGVPGRRR